VWSWSLTKLAECLGCCDWHTLDNDSTYRRFKRTLKEKQLGRRTIESMGLVLNKMIEGGVVNRIIIQKDLLRFANTSNVLQHIAIPIGMYSRLLGIAIKKVEQFHPYRHKISQVMSEYYAVEDKLDSRLSNGEIANVWFSEKRAALRAGIKHEIPDFTLKASGNELREIQLHCLIVVLAFSGIRIGEALSLEPSSYHEKQKSEGAPISLLRGETTKSESGVPRTVIWQTHPIVKDALELAHDMTASLRGDYLSKAKEQLDDGEFNKANYESALREINSTFIMARRKKHTIYSFTNSATMLGILPKALKLKATQTDVDEFNLLNPHREGQMVDGGYLPKLSNHDFRRSFAVFFKRYGFGSSTSIKFQYKHRNINMSDYYANNASLQAMEDLLMDNDLLTLMNEEGIKMGVDIFDDIYNKSEHLSGVSGERIANDKFQQLQSGERVYMARDEIESLLRNGSLSVVKLPTGGYCLNATCSRVCSVGQFNAEIKPCVHQVTTDKEAKVLLRQNKRLIASFREMNTGDSLMQSVLIGIKQKIQLNEITLNKHELEYEAFNDDVASIIQMEKA
jgi:integrase